MSTSDSQQPAADAPLPGGRSIIVLLVRWLLFLVIFWTILFVPAGRLDWLQAWLFLVAFALFLLFYVLWMRRKDPALLQERGRVAENVKPWDKTIISVYSVLLFGMLILAGLDAGRFGWSSPPVWVQGLGWLGVVGSGALVWWVQATNTFAGRLVRIQEDRGHTVVTSGPYRYVRHPMYTGIIVLMTCIPLALGSLWALIPGGLIDELFVLRTTLEDRSLQAELPGYKEYAAQVRYRLLPGVW